MLSGLISGFLECWGNIFAFILLLELKKHFFHWCLAVRLLEGHFGISSNAIKHRCCGLSQQMIKEVNVNLKCFFV